MAENAKILGVQYLRGFAALAVILCHYGSSIDSATLARVFNFGQNGVHVFFLISGFIITYSLQKANYHPNEFLKFLAKRSIRIDPPYYVTIILTISLFKILTLTPSFRGSEIPLIPAQLLAHLTYVVPFTNYQFYNHIFWTLCVEFQFYVLIGLFYFLSHRKIYKMGFLVIFCCSSFISLRNSYYLVITYAPIFCLGISLVDFYLRRKVADIILPVLFSCLIFYQHGPAIFLLLITACLIILSTNFYSKVLFWLGTISYSLYLTHGLVLIIMTGVLKKVSVDITRYQLLWLLIDVIAAILFSFLFYKFIEKPSLRISKQLFYKSKDEL